MTPNAPTAYQTVDTLPKLVEAVKTLENEEILAVDLEADSMYHFKEKVCLIQLATSRKGLIIDPLPIRDLSPLKPIFSNPHVKKVFHGADYDIRSLYRDFGIKINTLFDTQLAGRFLGIKETGLNAILQEYFNIELDKKFQKKDWSKRPLPEEMIEYAARDVLYLLPLAKLFEQKLYKKNRLFWVQEENKYLSRVRPVSVDGAGHLFTRFKGAGRLSQRELAVLEALVKLRMKIAEKKDKPLFKIIGNATLLNIVKDRPTRLRDLEKVRALSRKQIDMYGDDLIKAVKYALKIPYDDLPTYPRTKAPLVGAAVRKRIKALKSWRNAKSEKLKIDPALICSKALIGDIAEKNPGSPREFKKIQQMKNWQRYEFNEDILTVLRKADGRKY